MDGDRRGRGAGTVLVQAALLIWVTNVAAATLALWEVDRRGPFARDPRHAHRSRVAAARE